MADLSYPERDASERALNALPLLSIHLRAASACRQVQASYAGRALEAHGTGSTNVPRPNEPNSREGETSFFHEAVDDHFKARLYGSHLAHR